MNKTEFITKIREMADNLEKGDYTFIDLEGGQIFANRNYGKIEIYPAKGVSIAIELFQATEEEKNQKNNAE